MNKRPSRGCNIIILCMGVGYTPIPKIHARKNVGKVCVSRSSVRVPLLKNNFFSFLKPTSGILHSMLELTERKKNFLQKINPTLLFNDEDHPFDDLAFAEQLFDYLTSKEKTQIIFETRLDKEGNEHDIPLTAPNAPPMVTEFARKHGFTGHDMKKLAEMYPDTIGRVIEHAEDIAKEFMIENGLTGRYNSQFAIFISKNITDMEEKSKVDIRKVTLTTTLQRVAQEGSALVTPESSRKAVASSQVKSIAEAQVPVEPIRANTPALIASVASSLKPTVSSVLTGLDAPKAKKQTAIAADVLQHEGKVEAKIEKKRDDSPKNASEARRFGYGAELDVPLI